MVVLLYCFHDTATTEIYPLSLHDALPICLQRPRLPRRGQTAVPCRPPEGLSTPRVVAEGVRWGNSGVFRRYSGDRKSTRLKIQSRQYVVCRLLLEKKDSFLGP